MCKSQQNSGRIQQRQGLCRGRGSCNTHVRCDTSRGFGRTPLCVSATQMQMHSTCFSAELSVSHCCHSARRGLLVRKDPFTHQLQGNTVSSCGLTFICTPMFRIFNVLRSRHDLKHPPYADPETEFQVRSYLCISVLVNHIHSHSQQAYGESLYRSQPRGRSN